MTTHTNRYIVEVSLYIYAENDLEAIEQAQKFVDEQNHQLDNNCSIESIIHNNFGSLTPRVVYGNNN